MKPVNKPAKGTVPGSVNAGVGGNVPANATLPSAVNAGDGSSAPQGAPLWSYVLLMVGALGAFGASARLIATRKN